MTIKIYNTLSKKKEDFKPLNNKKVAMYVCGITPYDEVHLGHARAYVTFDIIRRHLANSGYKVTYVQNFTDIDDKIIKRANDRKISPKQLAEENIQNYFSNMDRLNVMRADKYPRVSETIPEIVKFIERLIEKNAAYPVDGDVYFSVRSFPEYGRLSKRNIDDLLAGARVEIGEKKNDPLDFALWKKTKPDEPSEVSFDSPWGKGRPGWHIECSVMSTGILGETLDIHGGGHDLIFPHHENEIAQTEAATGKPFVKYWIHNGFVTIDKEKMSKSLGNFFTLRQVYEKFDPRSVRYFLISQHYRSPLDFSLENLDQAKNALAKLDEAYEKIASLQKERSFDFQHKPQETLGGSIAEFENAMDDDFNTEKALAVLHEIKNAALSAISSGKDISKGLEASAIKFMLENCLGITVLRSENVPEAVKKLAEERETARKQKEWQKSDELRHTIDEMGFKVEDVAGGKYRIVKKH